ncbi:MAG: hypothetical protein IBJ10_01225 [Phycisphaerales bacterium]|nr:hypothetical protein [Phycisphaerales bacterium]
MAEWIVEGTERDGRTPRRETIEAPSAEAAKAEAYKRGMVPGTARRVRATAAPAAPDVQLGDVVESRDEIAAGAGFVPPGQRLKKAAVAAGFGTVRRVEHTDWLVRGAMRDTGVPVEIVVAAADPTQAQGIAHSKGLLVRDITQASAAVGRVGGPPMLIEKTAKKWKKTMLWGVVMTVASVPMCTGATGSGGAEVVGGVLLFWSGLAVFIGARIAAWWHHG